MGEDGAGKDALLGAREELEAKRISEETYREVLEQAWADYQITEDEKKLVEVLRKKLGISKKKHDEFEYKICERIGNAYAEKGDHENAIKFYSRMCELMPEDKSCWARAGKSYLGLGKLNEAKASLEKGLAIDGTDVELARLLGECNNALASERAPDGEQPHEENERAQIENELEGKPKIVGNKYENVDSKLDKRVVMLTPWEVNRKPGNKKQFVEEPKEGTAEPPKENAQPPSHSPTSNQAAAIPQTVVPAAQMNAQQQAYAPVRAYPCKSCGTMLTYIYQYKRWYCPGCKRYI